MSESSSDATRFATTRETYIEQLLQSGVRRAAGFYAEGNHGRGEWELILLAKHIARITGDDESLDRLEAFHYVPPFPDVAPAAQAATS